MNKKGFTLVELVIVIAIVIILSVVSVPIYNNYTYRAKISEGYALLGLCLSVQKNYYGEYGTFLLGSASSARGTWTCNETVLGIDARGNKYFTCFRYYTPEDTKKHYFQVILKKPAILITDEERPFLTLSYNLTSGATIIDNSK